MEMLYKVMCNWKPIIPLLNLARLVLNQFCQMLKCIHNALPNLTNFNMNRRQITLLIAFCCPMKKPLVQTSAFG